MFVAQARSESGSGSFTSNRSAFCVSTFSILVKRLILALGTRSVLNHPLLDQLDSSVRDIVPTEPVQFRGEWSSSSRRNYASEGQEGTGSGPFVDVVDLRWRGALTSANVISGIAFLLTAHDLYWVKTAEAGLTLPVDISLHAYAGYTNDAATFTASMAGACLPGVPVPVSVDLARTCALGPTVLTTGRVTCLARANSAAFFVLLIQRSLLKMGRKRLWRLRDDVGSSLPPGIRHLLAHGRTGSVRSQPR
jgi:hypothetical protein